MREQLPFVPTQFDENIEWISRNWWNNDGVDRQAGTPQDGSAQQSSEMPQDGSAQQSSEMPQDGSQPEDVSQLASRSHDESQLVSHESPLPDSSSPQVAAVSMAVSMVVSYETVDGVFSSTNSPISSKLKRLTSFACANGAYKHRSAKPTVSWLANFLIVLSPVRERQPVNAVIDVKWDGP